MRKILVRLVYLTVPNGPVCVTPVAARKQGFWASLGNSLLGLCQTGSSITSVLSVIGLSSSHATYTHYSMGLKSGLTNKWLSASLFLFKVCIHPLNLKILFTGLAFSFLNVNCAVHFPSLHNVCFPLATMQDHLWTSCVETCSKFSPSFL